MSFFFSLAKLNIFLMTLSLSETASPLITDCGSEERKSPSSNCIYISLDFRPIIKSKIVPQRHAPKEKVELIVAGVDMSAERYLSYMPASIYCILHNGVGYYKII